MNNTQLETHNEFRRYVSWLPQPNCLPLSSAFRMFDLTKLFPPNTEKHWQNNVILLYLFGKTIWILSKPIFLFPSQLSKFRPKKKKKWLPGFLKSQVVIDLKFLTSSIICECSRSSGTKCVIIKSLIESIYCT